MNRLLSANDLARVSTRECEGCGECCRGMGDTIHLDPYDIYLLTKHLHCTVNDLMDTSIGLHVEDGLVIPHLLMTEKSSRCTFLGADGRCRIHAFRPGFCRLFPLGREYRDGTFGYFIVPEACKIPGQVKVRIKNYLGYEDITSYERFTLTWHTFVREMQTLLARAEADYRSQAAVYLLRLFYVKPYDTEAPFMPQFEARLADARDTFS
jgi:Fe-S-cluster containining protein